MDQKTAAEGLELPPLHSLESCCEDPLLLEVVKQDAASTTTFPAENILVAKKNRARNYGATFICLALLERWLELGVRPSNQDMFHRAFQLILVVNQPSHSRTSNNLNTASDFSNEKLLQNLELLLWKDPQFDDLPLLKELVKATRRKLWNNQMEPCLDKHLLVGPSKIPGADMGLFAARDIPENAICCYYYGDVHSIRSSQKLPDASYLLRIGTVAAKPWWYPSLLPVPSLLDGEEDHADDSYLWLRQEWDRVGFQTTKEFFVDPTDRDIKARYINDCLQSTRYNVTFVLDPQRERAAVVTLRPICSGEELYVSYGQPYWSSLEATTGIVPRQLSQSDDDDYFSLK